MTSQLPANLERIVAESHSAAKTLATTAPRDRAVALLAVADALHEHADELIEIAVQETGLTSVRLTGELRRTAVQLRLFADVVIDGTYLDARIDYADGEYVLGVRPDLRRVGTPLGTVLNFAASNFPFAFSVAGGDSAAALAAGCPVIVKAHPGHPRLSQRTGEIVAQALSDSGMPAGVFAVIEGQDEGVAVLKDSRIRAGAFTGSVRVGQLLADIAAGRQEPIPFYGELGSLNPVFVTQQAIAERADELVTGLIGAVAGSAGQLCTKPGFVFVPHNHELNDSIAKAVASSNESLGEQRLLNPGIGRGFAAGREKILHANGVRVITEGTVRVDEDGHAWTTPTVVAMSAEHLYAQRDELLEETFGPLTVLVEVADSDDLVQIAADLFTGSLTATIHAGAEEAGDRVQSLAQTLASIAGRVLFGGWPTGVAVTYAQQHGGPSPATTNDSSTSVGTAAITRFMRPVAYQSFPQELLPAPLRDDNPWRIPQRIDTAGSSQSWGSAVAGIG